MKLDELRVGERFTLKEENMGVMPTSSIVFTVKQTDYKFYPGGERYVICEDSYEEEYYLDPEGEVERYEL